MAANDKLLSFRKAFSELNDDQKQLSKFDDRDVIRISEDNSFASSFLIWKKNEEEQALKLAVECLEWRKNNSINDLSLNDFSDEFYKKGILFLHGKDKDGNRILTMVGKLYTKDNEEETRKLLKYLLERLHRENPRQRVTYILDAGNTTMANVDRGLIRLMVDSFATYFPDLLAQILVVDMPTILTVVWNVVKLWLNEELREKIKHCARKDLGDFIQPDQLLDFMGGQDTWKASDSSLDEDLAREFGGAEDEFSDAVENLQIK